MLFKEIAIIVFGNVGSSLAKQFHLSGCPVEVIVCRNPEKKATAQNYSKIVVSSVTQIPLTIQVCILAVSDNAIQSVAQLIPPRPDLTVLHLSGASPLEALLPHTNAGVMWPLQTFTSGFAPDWKNIPLFLTADQTQALAALQYLASFLSSKIHVIDEQQRQFLHIAAVFANNFTNYMLTNAWEICQKHQLPFEVLLPMVNELLVKAQTIAPINNQTGPARRNDTQTLARQITILQKYHSEKVSLYQLISEKIVKTYFGND